MTITTQRQKRRQLDKPDKAFCVLVQLPNMPDRVTTFFAFDAQHALAKAVKRYPLAEWCAVYLSHDHFAWGMTPLYCIGRRTA